MARRDPLLPNAGIVARREYRDRVRSPLFLVSTVILMGLALAVALAPIAIRYLDQQRVDRIVVVADDDLPGRGHHRDGASGIMNIAPAGADPDTWTAAIRVRARDRPRRRRGRARPRSGSTPSCIVTREVRRASSTSRTGRQAPSTASGASSPGSRRCRSRIIDWTRSLPPGSELGHVPDAGLPGGVDQRARSRAARRSTRWRPRAGAFLGTVFIILMFITILIYGMWVATGVATEKSSRVMELMISAASPRQLLFGKVVGIGGAGLTQYTAIAIPAVLVLAFQDQIARAVLGDGGAGLPIGGLTIGLLARVRRVLPDGLHAVRLRSTRPSGRS